MEIDDEISAPDDGGGPEDKQVVCITNSSIHQIEAHLDDGKFLWLDLREATDQEIVDVGKRLDLHPLTVEDIEDFDQRAKVEEYPGYVYLVSYGAAPSDDADRLVEFHIVYSPEYLLTVAHDKSIEVRALHDRAEANGISGHALLHSVLDVLVDSYAPLLDDLDDQIGVIEEQILARNLDGQELRIHEIRKKLSRVDRVVHRQVESYTRLHEVLRRMPDADPDVAPYFRDIQDHLIRVKESSDSLRERVSDMFEIYFAALNNRQNVIMKQFTVIAGIFLPLSVLVGYFGMNFKFMTDHIQGDTSFLIFGGFFPVAMLAVLMWIIRGRGLFHE